MMYVGVYCSVLPAHLQGNCRQPVALELLTQVLAMRILKTSTYLVENILEYSKLISANLNVRYLAPLATLNRIFMP